MGRQMMGTVAVDPQKRAKMLAQFRRGFHNGGNAD
jgi:hypothetical protein